MTGSETGGTVQVDRAVFSWTVAEKTDAPPVTRRCVAPHRGADGIGSSRFGRRQTTTKRGEAEDFTASAPAIVKQKLLGGRFSVLEPLKREQSGRCLFEV